MRRMLFLSRRFVIGVLLIVICSNISVVASKLGDAYSKGWFDNYELNIPCKTVTVPDCVEVGDIVLIDFLVDQSSQWKRPGLHNEHGAIYIGNNTLVEANGVVRYRNYSEFYEWQKNLVFIRVKSANESQRIAAAEWAQTKIDFPYQQFFVFPGYGLKIADTNLSMPSAKQIYCMELLWAAYYNQGIDIDRNGWCFPFWVTGDDILYDNDVEVIYQELEDSTEISKPYKGVFLFNKKILPNPYKTIIFGPIDIMVDTSNDKIFRVDFYIDSVHTSIDTTPPFVWRWEECCTGEKTITAIASDDTGNQYEATISVVKYH